MTLQDIGWNAAFEEAFAPYYQEGWVPARLTRDNKITYGALVGDGEEYEAVMSGKVYHEAETDAELPAVGDWVALDVGGEDEEHVIRARLPRQTCFSRKMAGKSTEEQVIAANVDVVVVVTDAGTDFSLRRMERYFTIIARSGAKPVVLVNKSDLYEKEDNEEAAAQIQELNPDAEVHITCATKKRSLSILRQYLSKGRTVTLIGSSGVGKSSILNQLLGDEYQWTDDVNELTGKGRHTTTARELIILPKGGVLIDNPGIKEVQMWTDESTLREGFADIEELALQCKFGDCKHGKDAGCAIRAALEKEELDPGRYEGFLKLDEEIEKLRRSRKKRQMTVERRSKRELRSEARQRDKRRDPDHELEPRERRVSSKKR